MFLYTILCTLLVCSLRVVADDGGGADDVLVLADATFDERLAKVDLALVEFYAPWCGHCKALEPIFREVAATVAKDDRLRGVRLAKIDADAAQVQPRRYGVQSFPTIKLFRRGRVVEGYEGGRSHDAILAYLRTQASIVNNRELETSAALDAVTSNDPTGRTAVVGYFRDTESMDYRHYVNVVRPYASRGVDVYHVRDHDVLHGAGFYGDASRIVMYRPGRRPSRVTFRGVIKRSSLQTWIEAHARPAAGAPYTAATAALFWLSRAPLLTLMAPRGVAVDGAVMAVASAHPSMQVGVAAIEDFAADVSAHCGDKRQICGIVSSTNERGRGPLRGRSLSDAHEAVALVDEFVAGTLRPAVKSQPAAPPSLPGEVATVVGSTFVRDVIEADRDVFLEFYAPWCGHCKALAPKLEALAKAVAAKHPTLVVAKFDLTSNDLPEDYRAMFPVDGFPTMFLKRRGAARKPVLYEGERDVSAMHQWIERQRH